MMLYEEGALAAAIAATAVHPGEAAVFWLGQASFVLKFPDATLFIDPFLSDVAEQRFGWRRLTRIPLRPPEVHGDLVLFTHPHLDHLDPETVKGLPPLPLAGPTSCLARLRELGIPEGRLRPLNAGQSLTVGSAVVRAVKADHPAPDEPVPDAVGFWADDGSVSVYHAGDTIFTPEVAASAKACGRPDVLIVPVNGQMGNMGAIDAALFAGELRARRVIPCHVGMFAQNTADPYALPIALHTFGVGVEPVVLGCPGGYLYRREAE